MSQFKIQSVVFDLFHTLVDPEEYRPKDFTRDIKLAELFKMDPVAFSKYWSETHHERYTSNSKKTIDYVEEYVRKIKGETYSKHDLFLAELILGRYQDISIKNPNPLAYTTLATLRNKGLRLGLLSNADQREVSAWTNSSLSTLFDAACFSYEMGFMKPSEQAYSFVLNKLGTSAKNSIYVGDGGSDELKGAKNADFGLVVFMKEYVAKNGMRSTEEISSFESTADATINNLGEIRFLIDKFNQD